ncbi:MAG: amidase-like protein [Rhodospirillales bacterium]|nr:amidase-like protein [Rhodospirillales bacterium]
MSEALADPSELTVHELSAAIASRRLSPVDIMDALLSRIRRLDPKLHAYIALYEADARLAAEAADKAIRSGHRIGPLHGIPIAVKDLVDIEGRVTTGGSKVWQDRVSPTTALLVEKLRAAGMIILGKTHTVEFAMGAWGTNQHLGTPWNPWDLALPRCPGGSSSGSAVAVAGRLAPCAIGTDTGGSVRLPASFCGIVGLKTTIGRVSTYGVLPLAQSLDTIGPLTRSVEDAAVLFNLLQGPDARDPVTLRHAPDDPLPQLKRGVAGLRLAVLPQGERSGVDREILAAYDASVATLAGLGAEIVEIVLPQRFSDFARLTGTIIGAEGYANVGAIVDRMDLPVDDSVRPRIWLGKDVSARDYLHALRDREAVKRDFAAPFAAIDALLTPTTMTAAIPLATIDQATTSAHFTRMANFLDLCGLAVPNGFTVVGMPSSLQIVCKGYDEATALRIGWAFEQATDWHARRPEGI